MREFTPSIVKSRKFSIFYFGKKHDRCSGWYY